MRINQHRMLYYQEASEVQIKKHLGWRVWLGFLTAHVGGWLLWGVLSQSWDLLVLNFC